MNRTFKVVFNRARACLMVANEITSSVQKKGTKTVIASALAAVILGAGFEAQAANYTTEQRLTANKEYDGDTFSGEARITIPSRTEVPNTLTVKLNGTTHENIQLSGQGAAISIARLDPLEVTDSTFKNNTSTDDRAGAIYVQNFEITSTNFISNLATYAGAIYAFGTGKITGGTFQSNKTSSTTYGGGAIYFQGSKSLVINSTTFTSNTASDSNGGAIYLYGVNEATLNVNAGTVFEANEGKSGGAIYVYDEGILNVTGTADSNVIFKKNKAKGTSATNTGEGGAIYLQADAVLSISYATFEGNEANTYGGAIYSKGKLSVTNTSFSSSQATSGGALYLENSATIGDSTFTANVATTSGGAIYSGANSLTLNNSTFKGNSAKNSSIGNGGALYAAVGSIALSSVTFGGTDEGEGNTAGKNGGAIYLSSSKDNTITDSSFIGNTATAGYGGAIAFGSTTTKLTITGTNTFIGNSTKGSSQSGGAIYNQGTLTVGSETDEGVTTFKSNSAKGYGGAIYSTFNSSGNSKVNLAVYHAVFGGSETGDGNSAASGGAIATRLYSVSSVSDSTFTANEATNYGGAIYAAGTSFDVNDSIFSGNTAFYGGAIYQISGTLTINAGSTFGGDSETDGNKASGYAGAIYLYSGTLNIIGTAASNVFFKNNTATARGGAILLSESTPTSSVSISNANFTSNTAGNASKNYASGLGGALYLTKTSAAETTDTSPFSNLTFTSNKASKAGAIYVGENRNLSIGSTNTFTSNASTGTTTDMGGGAIFLDENATLTLGDTSNVLSFTGNTAERYGGAIYSIGTLTVTNTSFSTSQAKLGGAIYTNGTLNIKGTETQSVVFDNNKATSSGGAIYVANAAVATIENSKFTSNSGTFGGAAHIDGTLKVLGKNTFTSNESTSQGGGALYLFPADSTQLVVGESGKSTYSTFTNNSSKTLGGAIFIAGGTGTINSGHFEGNEAGQSGGAIALGPSLKTAISIVGSSTNKLLFSKNVANGTGSYGGGAIYVSSSAGTKTIGYATFTENTAAINGGAILLSSTTPTSLVTISNSSFTSNKAGTADSDYVDGFGGAIYLRAISEEETIDSTPYTSLAFTSNKAGTAGALYVGANRKLTIESTNAFTSNISTGKTEGTGGGAIFLAENATLTLGDTASSLKFESNTASYAGGALYTQGTLNIANTAFTKNKMTSSSGLGGGAIYVEKGETSITGGTNFTSNQSSAKGGAIYLGLSSSVATLTGSNTFTSNSAASAGGAIYVADGSLTIGKSGETTKTTFKSNEASTAGGAIYIDKGTHSITNADFGGTGTNEGNNAANGGSIYVAGAATTTISGTSSNAVTFTANKATAGSGGAIYASAGSTTNLKNATFTSNKATTYGGALNIEDSATSLDVDAVTFTSNKATIVGGAVALSSLSEVQKGSITFTDVTFEKNESASAGALSLGTKRVASIDGTSAFTGNKASSSHGGAIAMDADSSLTISGATSFTGNTASSGYYGGAIYSAGTLDVTGASFGGTKTGEANTASYGGAVYASTDSKLKLKNSKFTANVASNSGGAIFLNSAKDNTITDSSFFGNTATTGYGGAIYLDGTLKVTGASFGESVTDNANRATYGGAVYAGEGSKLTLENSTFTANVASNSGGAIYLNSANENSIASSSFTGNTATNGGAIYLASGSSIANRSVTLTGENTFTKNSSSAGSGGALYVGSYVTVNGTEADKVDFTGNKSSSNGGAIYVGQSSTVNLKNGQFTDNVADTSKDTKGGAFYLGKSASATISATETYALTGNQAKLGGFAYLGESASLTLEASEGNVLTVGKEGNVDPEIDSIASDNTFTSTLALQGAGNVVILGKTSDFSGKVKVGTDSNKTTAEIAGTFSSEIRSITLGEEAKLTIKGDQKLSSDRDSDSATSITLGNKAEASLKSLKLVEADADYVYTDQSGKKTATKNAIATLSLGEEAKVTSENTLTVGDCAFLEITGGGSTTEVAAKVTLQKLVTGNGSTTSFGSETSKMLRVEVTSFDLNELSTVTVKNGTTLATTSNQIEAINSGVATRFEDEAWLEFTDSETVEESTFETLLKNSDSTNAKVQNIRFENGVLQASDGDKNLQGDVNLHIGQMKGFNKATVEANRELILGKAGTTSEVVEINTDAEGAKLNIRAGKLVTKTKSVFANVTDADAFATELAKKSNVTIGDSSATGSAVSFDFIDKGTATLTAYTAMQKATDEGGVGTTDISLSNATLAADTSGTTLEVKNDGLTLGAASGFEKITVGANVTFNLGHKTLSLTSVVDDFDLTATGAKLNLTGGTLTTTVNALFTVSSDSAPFTGVTKKEAVAVDNSNEVINLTDKGTATLSEYEDLRTALGTGEKLLNVNLIHATVKADSTTTSFTTDANLTFGALTGFETVNVGNATTLTLAGVSESGKTVESHIKNITFGEGSKLSLTGGRLATMSASLFEDKVSEGTTETSEFVANQNKKGNVLIANSTVAIDLLDLGVCGIDVYEALKGKLTTVNGDDFDNLSMSNATLKANDTTKTFTVKENQSLSFGAMTGFETVTLKDGGELNLGKLESSAETVTLGATTNLNLLGGTIHTTRASLLAGDSFADSAVKTGINIQSANVNVDFIDEGATVSKTDYLDKVRGSLKVSGTSDTLKGVSLSHSTLAADNSDDGKSFTTDANLTFGAMAGFNKVIVSADNTLHVGYAGLTSSVDNFEFATTSAKLYLDGGTLNTKVGALFTSSDSASGTEGVFTNLTKKDVTVTDANLVLNLTDTGTCEFTDYDQIRTKLGDVAEESSATKLLNVNLVNSTLKADATSSFTTDANLTFGAMTGFTTVEVGAGKTLKVGNAVYDLPTAVDTFILGEGSSLNFIGGSVTTKTASVFTGVSTDAFATDMAKNTNVSIANSGTDNNVTFDFIDKGTAELTTYSDMRTAVGTEDVSLSKATLHANTEDKSLTVSDSLKRDGITFAAMTDFATVTVGPNKTLTLGNKDLKGVSSIDTITLSTTSGKLHLVGGKLQTKVQSILTGFDSGFEATSVAVKDGVTIENNETTKLVSFDFTNEATATLDTYMAMRTAVNTEDVSLSKGVLQAGASDKAFNVDYDLAFGAMQGFESATVADGKTFTLGKANTTSSIDEINLGADSKLNLTAGKLETKTKSLFSGADTDAFASGLTLKAVEINNTDSLKNVSFDFIDEETSEFAAYENITSKVKTGDVSLSNANLKKSDDGTFTVNYNLSFGALGGDTATNASEAFTKVTVAAGKTLTLNGIDDVISNITSIDLAGTDSGLVINGGSLATTSASLFGSSLVGSDKSYTTRTKDTRVALTDADATSIDLIDEGTATREVYDNLVTALSNTDDKLKNLSLSIATLKGNSATDTFTVESGQNLSFGAMTNFANVIVKENSELHLLGTTDNALANLDSFTFANESDAKLFIENGAYKTQASTFLKPASEGAADTFTSDKRANVYLGSDVALTLTDTGSITHANYDDLRAKLTGADVVDSGKTPLKSLSLSRATLTGNSATDYFDTSSAGTDLTFGAMKDFEKVTVAEGKALNLGHADGITLGLVSKVYDFNLTAENSKLNLIGGTLTTKAAALFDGDAASGTPFTEVTKKTGVTVTNSDQVINLTDTGSAKLSEYEALRTALKSGTDAKLLNVNPINATITADGTKRFTSDANLTFGALSGFESLTVAAGNTVTIGNGLATLTSSIDSITLNEAEDSLAAGALVINGGKLTTAGASLFSSALTDSNQNHITATKKTGLTLKNASVMSIDLTDVVTCDVDVYTGLRNALSEVDGAATTPVKNLSLPNATLAGNATTDTFTLEAGQTLTFDAVKDFNEVTIGTGAKLYLLGERSGDTLSKLGKFSFSAADSELHLEKGKYQTSIASFVNGTTFDASKRDNVFLGSSVDLTLTDQGTITHAKYNELKERLTGSDTDDSLTKLSLINAVLEADDEADGGRNFSPTENLTFGAMTGFEKVTVSDGKTLTLSGATDSEGNTVTSSITDITYENGGTLKLNGASLKTNSISLFNKAVVANGNFTADGVTKLDSVLITDATTAIDLLDEGICDFETYEALKGALYSAFTDLSLSNALLKGDANTSVLTVGANRSLTFGALQDFKEINVAEGGKLNLEGLDSSTEVGEDTAVTIANVGALNLNGGRIKAARKTLLNGTNFAESTALRDNIHVKSKEVSIDFTDTDPNGVTTTVYNQVRESLGTAIEDWNETTDGTTKVLKNVSLLKTALVGTDGTAGTKESFTTDADVTFGAMQNFGTVNVNNHELHIGNTDESLESTVDSFEFSGDTAKLVFEGGSLKTNVSALFNAENGLKGGVTVANASFVLNLTDTERRTLTEYEQLRTALSNDSFNFRNVNMENATIDADSTTVFNADADLTFGAMTGFDKVTVSDGKTLSLGKNNSEATLFASTVNDFDLSNGNLKLEGGTIETTIAALFKDGASNALKNVTVTNSDLVVNFTDEGTTKLSDYEAMRKKLDNADDASDHLVNVNMKFATLEADGNQNFTSDGNLSFGAMTGFNEVSVDEGKTLTIGKTGANSDIKTITLGTDSLLAVAAGELATGRNQLVNTLTDNSYEKKTGITLDASATIDVNDGIETTFANYKKLQTALGQSAATPLTGLSLSKSLLKGDGTSAASNDFVTGNNLKLSFGAIQDLNSLKIGDGTTVYVAGQVLGSGDASSSLKNVSFGNDASQLHLLNGKVVTTAKTFLANDTFDAESNGHVYLNNAVDVTLTNEGEISHSDYNALKAKLTSTNEDEQPLTKLSLNKAVLKADSTETGGTTFTPNADLTFGAMTGFDTVTVGTETANQTLTLKGTKVDGKNVASQITEIVLAGDSKLNIAGGTLKTKSTSLFDSAVSDGSSFVTQEKKSNISIALDAGIDLMDTGTCTFANYEALRGKLGDGTTALANLSLSNALLKGDGTNNLYVGSGQNLSFGAISGFNTVNVTAGGMLTLGETQKDLSSVLGENTLTIEGVSNFNLAGGKISTKRSTLVRGADFAESLAKTGVNILSQEVEIDITDEVTGGVTVADYNKVRTALGVKDSSGTSEALKNVSLSQSALVGSNDRFTADASVSFGAMQNFSSVALNGKELHIGSKDVDLESTVGDFVFTGDGSSVTFDGGKLRTSSSALFNSDYALKGDVTVTNSDFVLNLTDTDTKTLSQYNAIRTALRVEGSDYLKNVNLEAAALEADGDKKLNADANLTFKTVTGFEQITIGAGNTLTLKEGTSDIENVVFTDDTSKLKLINGGITTNLSTFFKGEARDDVQFDSTLTKRNIEIENTDNFVVTLKDAGECDIDQYNAIRNQLGSTLEVSAALKHVNLINGTLAANERTTSFTTDADQLTFGAMTGFTDVTVATGHTLHIGNAASNLVSTIDNITVESGANVYLEGGVLNTNASAILKDSGVGESLFARASKKTGITVTSEALRLNFKDEGTALLSDYNAVRTALKAQSTETLLKAVSLENATLKADGEKTFTTDANLTFGAMSGFSKVTVNENTTLHLGHETLNLVSTTENLEVNGELNIVGKANNGADMTVHVTSSLTGSGKITVGDPKGEGADIRVHSLSMTGGSLFIDPFYENAHSTMTIDELEGGLNSNLTVGNNALLVIGDTVANAQETLANLAAKTPSFSANKAIAYVATPISISELGSIIINPSASSVETNTDATTGAQTGSVTITHSDADPAEFDAKSVYIADYAALVIDQAQIGSSTVFTGASSIDFDDDGVLAIVNADEGTIDLGGETPTTGLRNVITDNPYYDGTVDENGNIVVEQNAAQGNLAVASTGIQAMTRRADFVLAQTVSNRSYEERDSDVSLWVDVGGEGYKASRMANGGSFKSDMGYGVFGADYAFGNGVLAGAAFQYGKGTVRGGFESIKNKVKNYAGTAYVAFAPGKAKFVLDAAYVKQDNSITSAKTAFNQSVDSEMFSVGAAARAGFKVGNVELTPSVGVRVSKLKTDAMRSGNLKIAKQSQTLVQMPISLRMKTQTLSEDGWTLEPSAKISFVPTFGDKELKILNREQTVLDTNPIQGDLGIALKKGNLKIDATFSYGSGSQGTTSIGGKVGLKYFF